MLTEEMRAAIEARRKELHSRKQTLGICDHISKWVFWNYGFRIVQGYRRVIRNCEYYKAEESVYHFWNIMPDGSILDCSADQFDEPE
jgi:hypothetical protein